ncbi:hypothetical protein Tco_0066254 [Tanacetum coccineum]
MVAFLKKPQGSEDFHQILDFINGSYIRTLDNGEIEINATVDGQDKTITEASVRRHLKLADADGISTLPTTEIFEQLALMGKTRNRTKRMGIRIPQSNVLSSVADEAITKEMHDRLGRATTTASSLEAEQGSELAQKVVRGATLPWGSYVQARPERLSNLPNEPPLGEGKVTTLENELSNTKAIHNKALITLTKRVKKLEKKLKLKRRSAVVDSSEDEEASLHNEDSSKRGRMIEEIMKMKCKLESKRHVIPLAIKSSIVSWKSYCKEDVGYYEIHRADGSYKTYMFFSEMLNDFDREDLIVLYRLFNEKYASTRPGFDDLMLWGDMKIMFEPNDDDAV